MSKRHIPGWLAGVLLAASLWNSSPVLAAERLGVETEIKLYQPVPSNAGIDISDDYAVWMNQHDDSFAIVLYDLAEEEQVNIAANGKRKRSPRVDGNHLVWIDYRHGNGEIYLYEVDSKREKRLTTGAQDPQDVDVQGNLVVWSDQGNIHIYDLSRQTQSQLTTHAKASHPAVYGSYVVWEDERNGNADIYVYNLSTNKEIRVTSNADDQRHPSIYQTKIVYEDVRNGNSELYLYDLANNRERRLTTEFGYQGNPVVYRDYIVYNDDGNLAVYDLDEKDSSRLVRSYDTSIGFAYYGDYVLYGKEDDDDVVSLYLHDLDRNKSEMIGGSQVEPSQPDASDRYIVYVERGDSGRAVMLHDLTSKQTKRISAAEHRPERPLVSGTWVVYYETSEDALYAYSIKTGQLKKVTGTSDEPHDELYELDGNDLVWLNEDGRDNLVQLTNLSTNRTVTVAKLGDEPINVDIYNQKVLWAIEEEDNTSVIVLYDVAKDRKVTIERDKAEVSGAHIGDEFVVWSENNGDDWNLYLYLFANKRVYPMLKNDAYDQVRPQASRHMIVFEDNYESKGEEYKVYLYDAERSEFRYTLSEEAEPEDLRIGGNRIVWVDGRDSQPTLYTLAFARAQEEEDDDEPLPGEYTEYNFWEIVFAEDFVDIINSRPMEQVKFVFYAGTEDEVIFGMDQLFDEEEAERFIRLMNDSPNDQTKLRLYH